MIAGLLLLGLGVVFGFMRGDKLAYFFHAYLVAFCFYLSISLGGLFFVALQHAARAGWSVAVRRVGEIIAANILLMVVLFLPLLVPILMGNTSLYEWLDPQVVAADHILQAKSRYLNLPFFTARAPDLLWHLVRAGVVFLAPFAGTGSDRQPGPVVADGAGQLSGPDSVCFNGHVCGV